MTRSFVSVSASALLLMAAFGCETAPKTTGGKTDLETEASVALSKARTADPSIGRVISESAGHAVFPKIGKGAVGVGGAYGKGVLYQGNAAVGYCDMTQASIGLQLGGQTYTEIIVFKSTEALDRFKGGHFVFDAQATAVAVRSGAAANASYSNGVAVFTMDAAGLMFESSVGGQKFSYEPK